MPDVAVLFARRDSVYRTIPGCDVWDVGRDAMTWPGGCPVVAHPPCRMWSKLRLFARPVEGEADLARFAVRMVRTWGGVLEHPAHSKLWPDRGLPRPGERDAWGGWTMDVPQKWWGHKAEKPSWFYVVGVEPWDVPEIPYTIAPATHMFRKDLRRQPEISKAERERTPPALATWLVELARRTAVEAPR